MTISRIKQIKRILKNADVRDPRGALQAIAAVIVQSKPEKAADQQVQPTKPAVTIRVFNDPRSDGPLGCGVEIAFSRRSIEPRHLKAAMIAAQQLGDKLYADGEQCDDPDCPVHGVKSGITTLDELFKQFEADAKKASEIKDKGGLQ